jgi:hypothetical protein
MQPRPTGKIDGMTRRETLTGAIVIGVLASVVASAQVRYRPTETGPWRPWSFTATASARQARGATAAEVQAYQARLQELAAIVKRAPAVAQPIGFAAETWGHLAGYGPPAAGQPAGKSVPLAGAVSFGAFPLIEFTRNGRLMNEDMKGGETQLLQFVVNRIEMDMYSASKPMEWGAQEVDAFTEPRAGEPVSGLSRVDDVLIVKKNPKPLWVPLSVEDALKPVIEERRLAFVSRRDVFAKQAAEFKEWQSPAKRAERRAGWERAAASMPNGPEFLANAEKSDAAIESMNRERLAPNGPEARGVTEAERELAEAAGILTALTPEQRSAPSCYQPTASPLEGKFRPAAGAPAACRPLVRPNWEYFDPKLPRSAPQVLMVTSFTRCLTKESMAETSRGGCVINRALMSSLDWDAVRAWLDR